jgi:precorrin-4 methylase
MHVNDIKRKIRSMRRETNGQRNRDGNIKEEEKSKEDLTEASTQESRKGKEVMRLRSGLWSTFSPWKSSTRGE